jgi:general secretion pathway protein M
VRIIDREQAIALGILLVLVIVCASSLALSLEMRSDAVQERSDRQDVLSRLETRLRSRTDAHGQIQTALAPANAFLDAPTPGLAGADLQAYVTRLADRHAALVSFGVQGSGGDQPADAIRLEASMDIGLSALQVLLYRLESETPYVFVDSMTVRSANATPARGTADSTLRVTLGLRALWHGARRD